MAASKLCRSLGMTLNCNRALSRQCQPFVGPCKKPRRSFSLQAAATSYNFREVVSTESAPGAVGPYSQAIKTSNLVFCSGQVALVPGTKDLAAEDVEGQTEQVMKNLGAVLEAAGSSFPQVVKTTVLLTDMADFGAVNAIYGRYFAEEPPARACYAVKDLPLGAKKAFHLRNVFDVFPDELWLEILSHLRGKDLGRAVCVSKQFSSLTENAWMYACARRWPQWHEIARAPDTQWRRQYELLELRERELAAVPSVAAIVKLQTCVNARHRTILTEWLAEVSWDWCLDSTIVFKAVNYVDHHLAAHRVEVITRLQLVGIACLRAAMSESQAKAPQKVSKEDLDPQRFSYISDSTYTPAQVEELTAVIKKATPEHVKAAPSAKMFLRSFWYRAVTEGLLVTDEMHLYTIASFLLQLGLLDLDCSGYTASCVAASALSIALEIYGKPAWSPALQHYSAYRLQDLAPCKRKLQQVQDTLGAERLRRIWRAHHENHGYDEYKDEWVKALCLISCQPK